MADFQINIANRDIRKRVFIFAVLFFMWGLLTVLNFELIGHLRIIFNLSYAPSTLINITFFAAYLIISLRAGGLIKKVGYKNAIIMGWLLACLGCFIFYYAVYIRNYKYFLGALFVLAAGITILQVGANLYVVLLGNNKNAGSRLTLVQAFNSLGTFVAPLFASSVLNYHTHLPAEVRKSLDPKDLLFMDAAYVHYPYLYLGILMLLFAVVLFFTNIPNIDTSNIEPLNKITSLRKRHAMHFSQLRLGAFAIFAYVGAEVALANYIETFARDLTQYYWGAAMIGRFIGAILLLRFSIRNSVAFCASMSVLLILLSIFTVGKISVWFVVCVGLFNSILFPSLFTLGVNGLGKFSIDGSAILIMFIVGGAVVPFNVLNYSYVSYQIAFIIPIICYVYIGLYGYRFSRFEIRDELKDKL
ncbi:MAG TPA: sugar MFS transporter [Cytophagaceae bacterium]|nr:sugar MFS transporter [Cytophagaceae bacterium]